MRRVLLWINLVLISFFGVSSGLYKVFGGAADIQVFSHLGMGPTAVAVFGAVQAIAGGATAWPRSRRFGGIALAACNALATAGLFAAGVQPFGAISMLFVAMALVAAFAPIAPRAVA